MTNLRLPISLTRRLTLGGALLLIVAIASLAAAQAGTAAKPSRSANAGKSPRAHAAATYLTGIGDETTEMFGDPNWKQLHTKIARYIVPFDAAVHSYSLDKAKLWMKAAESQHIQVLVAFYHSEYSPTKMPSVAQYQHDVQKFIKLFPKVRQYQSWNEANRGNIRGVLASPSASAAARYYQALIRVCKGCTAIGLDVLDANNISPTLRYISEFKREIGKLRTVMPKIWGLHNYSDINRLQSSRTRQLSRALGGQVWLTETGGIVQFGGAFPNRNGSGLKRAAKVLNYMFNVAASQPRIKRLYIYDWTGGNARTRFDAGLTDNHHVPRPGYVVVCKRLHGAKCNVKTSRH
jgi:Glycosyl hydrolase catalytic core